MRENLLRDRLEFRRLLQKYHLMDLIGDENESIEWFRQIMLELSGWVNDKERSREILRRFKEENDRQREERERFEGAVKTGDSPGGETKGRLNPYSGSRFRRFNM